MTDTSRVDHSDEAALLGPQPAQPAPAAADRPSAQASATLRATSWHSVWIAVFVPLLGMLALTGVLLMTTYSPSISSAWGSVWYIQTQLHGGWFIRGLHRFGSDAFIALSTAYLAHLVIQRLYGGPHYGRWLTGLAFLFGGMAVALTGHLLPWDQHGYWGTTVRLNILARTPLVGDQLRALLVGGTEMGALTLTRLYTLHILLLPGALAGAAVWWVRRERHGSKTHAVGREARRDGLSGDRRIAPARHAMLRNATAWLLVFTAIATAAWYTHGRLGAASLTAPADPIAADYPARPEWFNLFLFQWLKAFHGPVAETVGSVALPSLILLMLIAVPWVDRRDRRGFVRRLTLLFCAALAIGTVWLTIAALRDDAAPPDTLVAEARARQANAADLSPEEAHALRAAAFNVQRANAAKRAGRALELANQHGIPPDGPLSLLANDPVTRGPELFAAHCASCHRYEGHNGLGDVPAEPATSSDLAGFATRAWIAELLADPMSTNHFGLMKKPNGEPAHTRMSRWLEETRSGWPDDQARAAFEANLDAVAAYLESESLDPGHFADTIEVEERAIDGARTAGVTPPLPSSETTPDDLIRRGRAFFLSTCNECHSYHGERSGTFRAPEMFGYGSVDWIERMIRDPSDNALYRSRGREPAQMPSFTDKLTERERRLIAQWLHATRTTTPSVP